MLTLPTQGLDVLLENFRYYKMSTIYRIATIIIFKYVLKSFLSAGASTLL